MVRRKKQIEKLLEDIQVLKRKILARTSSSLKSTHITASEWLVLQYLRKNEGATVKEIARTLSMTSSAATQLVESLVQKKYVVRKTNSDDKRALALSLSDKSKKHLGTLWEKRVEIMAHVFDALTDTEFESYCRLFDKIARNLAARKNNKRIYEGTKKT
ncbi:MAG: MarR family transcriptional regulator [Candidatus Pacebacteria bacterium]|nr:MarR family transcriptional regulator [Candidatus Paceibacterota bacterium]MDR3582889.1 MarR family transcriptional regulator [Candidatus Paceibacterota bacterium]